MSNLASPLHYNNNPILNLQNISKEFCDDNRKDTPIHAVTGKLNLKRKNGELVTFVGPSRKWKKYITKQSRWTRFLASVQNRSTLS